MSSIPYKEREKRRIAILVHNGLNNVLNDLKPEDYQYIFTSTGPVHIENLFSDYHKYINYFEKIYKDTPDRKITIFDKALCLAMSMEQHLVISLSGFKGRKPVRFNDLNEKVIANTVVDFLHESRYLVKGFLMEGTLDLTVYEEDHKKELKQLKSLLATEFKKVNFDYNACLAILIKLYTRGIIYQAGFDTEMEVRLAENLRVRENVDAHGVQVSACNEYREHKKRFRR